MFNFPIPKAYWVTLLSLILSLNTNAQTVKAKAHDVQNLGLSDIRVKATWVSDSTVCIDTTTDAAGYFGWYSMKTGLGQWHKGTEIVLSRAGQQLLVTTRQPQAMDKACLYTLEGKLLAQSNFQPANNKTFKASFDIYPTRHEILIYSDGSHVLKLFPGKIQINQSTKIKVENRFKSTESGVDVLFHIDDDANSDQYQPIDSVLQLLYEQENQLDFTLLPWPAFYTNLYFNLSDKYGNTLEQTLVKIDALDGSYSNTISTNEQGIAQATDIEIPNYPENKLKPDSLNFAIEIVADDYIRTHFDTLKNITAGDTSLLYNQLTPKQQEFEADLTVTAKNQETQETIPNANINIWTQGSDTIRGITNDQGKIEFQDINIEAENEITPKTVKYYIKASGEGLETKIDSINLTQGEFSKTIYVNEKPPEEKTYTLSINSQNEKKENLPFTNWTLLTNDSILIREGNTGANSLDTIIFQNTNDSIQTILKTNKEEHTNYREEKTLKANETRQITTINELINYLYELKVSAKDSETNTKLDSIQVATYLNGELLMQGNSLGEKYVNMQTTKPGHELDVKLIIDRKGYEKSDSIPITIRENEQNELETELKKEEVESEYCTAIIKSRFVDPNQQRDSKADFIFSNLELGISDTLKNISNLQIIWDTVQVFKEGNTIYNVKILPKVQEGDIPMYDYETTITLVPNLTTAIGPTLLALKQHQIIKGKVISLDTKENVRGVDVIIRNLSGQVLDSIRTQTGEYRTGPYNAGFQGTMDVHIPNDHPENKDEEYFGHRKIPIVPRETSGYSSGDGPVLLTNKITEFKDSTKTYNIALQPTKWKDAKTQMLAQVNPAHIASLDVDNKYNLALTKFGETNVYFKPSSENNWWFLTMAKFIERNFGIEYKINVVDTPFPTNGITVTSMDDDYLNSIKDQMGMNAKTVTGSGITFRWGYDEFDDLNVHTTTDITITGPPSGQQGFSQYMTVAALREMVHRALHMGNIDVSYCKGIGNMTTPTDLDTTKMVYDHINYSLIHELRKSRINEDENRRIHSGSWTIRPNENSDFYSTKTQSQLYSEPRWKNWDGLGHDVDPGDRDFSKIPEFNRKFFR